MARVLVVSPDPESTGGGVERFCHLLADVLTPAGHEVRIVGPTATTGKWSMRFGTQFIRRSRSVPLMDEQWLPDVIVTNGFLGGRRSHRMDTRTIHVFHGTMVGAGMQASVGRPRRERIRAVVGGGVGEWLAARGASNVAVSESSADEVRRLLRVPIDAIVENGVDTDLFRPRDRIRARASLGLAETGRYALFVGRPEAGKAPDVALAGCRAAGFELLTAGPRDVSGARHLGLLSPSQLATAYAASDCVVLPSQYEACSFVVLEALSCGVPVLSTNVGWVPTLLAHVPNYATLVVLREASDVARALGELGRDEARSAVAEASKYVRSRNSMDVFAAAWRNLIERGYVA